MIIIHRFFKFSVSMQSKTQAMNSVNKVQIQKKQEKKELLKYEKELL